MIGTLPLTFWLFGCIVALAVMVMALMVIAAA